MLPKVRLPARPISEHDGWCDDPRSSTYNRLVHVPNDWSAEKMWREDGLYDLVVVVGYNDDPPEGEWGSAIFLHVAREDYAPTRGCVAFSLADLLLKASLNPEAPTAGVRCEQCGFTQNDFKKHGRFGCPQCYATFSTLVEPMLDNMHKGTTHTGKIPQCALARKSLYDRLTKLELDLTEAIKSERYEDAARARDEISQVKQTVPSNPKSAR